MDLRKRITCAEISDLILKGILSDKTPDEEKAFIDFIEKALRTSTIKKEAIILGKRKNDGRNITLADIWEEQIER